MSYNQQAYNRLWHLNDIPPAWPGYQILDHPAQEIDWPKFKDHVREFQEKNNLTKDGKLGLKETLPALKKAYAPKTDPDEIIYRLGPLNFTTPETGASAPANRITGKNSRERRIANTWNQYGAEIARQAALEDIPTEAALAVFATEAGGQSHDPETNLVIIRYEPHIFKRKTGKDSPAARGDQSNEWQNLTKAAAINLQAAIWSTSWGLPQIMGFNYQVTRHKTPEAMAQAFQGSSAEQIRAFFDFIKKNNLTDHIRSKNWRSFARRYNGPGQIDYYSSVLTGYMETIQTLKKRGAAFAP